MICRGPAPSPAGDQRLVFCGDVKKGFRGVHGFFMLSKDMAYASTIPDVIAHAADLCGAPGRRDRFCIRPRRLSVRIAVPLFYGERGEIQVSLESSPA